MSAIRSELWRCVRSPSCLLGMTCVLLALAGPARAENADRLTSRPRPTTPAVEQLAIGAELRTGSGQRRRVVLPDGSVLVLNQDSIARLDAARLLMLTAGEAFLEAAPADADFQVRTTKRIITTRTGRFAVRAASAHVLVTGGQVQSDRVTVRAGEQLPGDADQPQAAPRASHALEWLREPLSTAAAPLVPASSHAGGALIAVNPDGQEAKLGLRKYHIDVHIEDGFARTTIDQTFFNQEPTRLEGTFYLPLPADASLSRLAMYVDGNLMEGGMVERDFGRTTFETIVTRQKDPALLEWVDGSTFKMRVFPLEPRQEKRIVLSYSQPLSSLYGRQTYRFPAGHSLPAVRDWSFQTRVKGGARFDWTCDSHTLKATKEGPDLLLAGAAQNVAPTKDVVLYLSDIQPADAQRLRFSSAELDGVRYLGIRYRPSIPSGREKTASRQPRDWLFLVETSGDREPLLARAQIEIVRELLAQADPADRFTVLAANTRTRAWAQEPRPVTPANAEAALGFLDKAHLIGALDLGGALDEAASLLKQGRNPCLVHVGSGTAALGERDTAALTRKLGGITYVGVGVGKRWNRNFMKAAAEKSGGLFAQINPDEPINWRAFELAATLDTPRLLDVQLRDANGQVRFLNTTTAVADGEEVFAVARLEDGRLPEAITLVGSTPSGPVETKLTVDNVRNGADYLPRTWARLEIDRLLAENAAKHKEQIIALSKAMYVMTPFTSLLVLESEAMHEEFKVERGRKDHWALYACPPTIPVVYEPLAGMPADVRGLSQNVKPNVQQVTQTIVTRRQGEYKIVLGPPGPNALFDAYSGETRGKRHFSNQGWGRNEGPLSTESLGLDPDVPLTIAALSSDGRWLTSHGVAGMPMAILRSLPDALSESMRRQQRLDRAPGHPLHDPEPTADVQEQIDELFINVDTAFDPELLNLTGRLDRGPALYAYGGGNTRLPGWHGKSYFIWPGQKRDSVLYERPLFQVDAKFFYDLVAMCPGMDTTAADTQTVLEAEAAPNFRVRPGKIDAQARKLFVRPATPTAWSWTLPAENGQPALTIHFDSNGNYNWDRKLLTGLREQVVCDGSTLQHLYPDLGIGARRTVSRFHRLDFARLVPWYVPPAEDLTHGADLVAMDKQTVALVPHGADTKGADGKLPSYVQLRFVFAADGRLSERQAVEMPAGKMRRREILGTDGAIRYLDGDGKELSARKGQLTVAPGVLLKPATKDLVVLSLPYRTPDQVRKQLAEAKKDLERLNSEEALPLFAAFVAAGNANEADQTFRRYFRDRNQRAIGFYVLLAAAGHNLDSDHGNVLADHPEVPLAQYLGLYSSPVLRKHASQWAAGLGQWPEGFLRHLAVTHALYQRWQAEKLSGDDAQRRTELTRALDYVRKNRDSAFSWGLLGLIQDKVGQPKQFPITPAIWRELAETYRLFEDQPGLEFSARFERARCLARAGDREAARAGFRTPYEQAVKDGLVPVLDYDFREALLGDGKGADPWGDLVRQTADGWVKQKRRSAVLVLARQCADIDDAPLTQELLTVALADAARDEQPALTMAAIELLLEIGEPVKADRLLRELLTDPRQARSGKLWRLGMQIAQQRALKARELECLERALDAEYASLPEIINLNRLREDYGKLLQHYQNMAEAMAALELKPPMDFQARLLRTADRWRALDPEAGSVCKATAEILRLLGERELVWDYLTTPVGLQPHEAAPLAELGRNLARQGEPLLADRAFAAAFAAEATNAQLLWERAQNLRQAGKASEAKQLLLQLAEGEWQPRFQGLKTQARWQLDGR